jgi:hypothetical protein
VLVGSRQLRAQVECGGRIIPLLPM